MIEKHFFLEDADPAIFFGAGNANLRLVRALRPKLRIMGRDNVLKVMGAEEDMAEFEESFKRLQQYCVLHNQLDEEQVIQILKNAAEQTAYRDNETIVYSMGENLLFQEVLISVKSLRLTARMICSLFRVPLAQERLFLR